MANHLTDISEGYRTPPGNVNPLAAALPTVSFYAQAGWILARATRIVKRGEYTLEGWRRSAWETLHAAERCGAQVSINGIQHIAKLDTPYVVVANHMSTLETWAIVTLVGMYRFPCFVIKESLLRYPVFKHVMRWSDPIAVTRTDPRQDLRTVFEEGLRKLAEGRAIIVFPQTTRSQELDPARFNSIGVKLAKKAGVPVVPLALKTNFWGNGTVVKDFGPIDPRQDIHFEFAPAIDSNRRTAHDEIVGFIRGRLMEWNNKSIAAKI